MGNHKKQNTVVLNLRGIPIRLTHLDVQTIIQQQLQLTVDQVIAIHYDTLKNLVFLKVSREELADRIVNSFPSGLTYKDPQNGTEYPVPMAREIGLTSVRVHQVSIDVPNSLIASALAPYGTVIGNVINETYGPHMPYATVYTGVRTVRMKLTKAIPSFLEVDGEKTLVTYNGQSKTCMRCGSTEHFRSECTNPVSRGPSAMNRVRTMAAVVSNRFAEPEPLHLETLHSTAENNSENLESTEANMEDDYNSPPDDQLVDLSIANFPSLPNTQTPDYGRVTPETPEPVTAVGSSQDNTETPLTQNTDTPLTLSQKRTSRSRSRKPYSRSKSKVPKTEEV